MKLCLLLFSFTWLASYAQSDSIQYFDAADRNTHIDKAAYYRKLSKPDTGKIYLGTEYWMDGHIKMTGHSLDVNFLYKIGKFTYYYKNGNKSGEGQYYSNLDQHVFGFKNKKWETWYPNGKPKEEWIYKIADDFTYAESFLMSFWDTTGAQLTAKGNGTYYYSDIVTTKQSPQRIVFTGPVHQGIFDSLWHGYYSNGKLYTEEFYKDGKVEHGKSFDETGTAYKYDSLETQPAFPGGAIELNRFVKLNLQVPAGMNSDVLRSVVVRVFVGVSGFVGNATIVQGVNPAMDGEAMRVAKALPRFLPATRRGQPVDSYYTFPVSFNLP